MRIASFNRLIAYAQLETAGLEGSRAAILLSRVNSGGFASLSPQGLQPMYGVMTGSHGAGGGSGSGGGTGPGGGMGGGGGGGGGGGTLGGQNNMPVTPRPGSGVAYSGVGGSGNGDGGNFMAATNVNGRIGQNPKNRLGCPDCNCFGGGK